MRSSREVSDEHIDWSRFGKASRIQVNAEAAAEKAELRLVGKRDSLTVHVNGERYEIEAPDVRAIRVKLKMTQKTFATRFSLSLRTVQQWEQYRTTPDMPARILLKAIEQSPDTIAEAALAVRREFTTAGQKHPIR